MDQLIFESSTYEYDSKQFRRLFPTSVFFAIWNGLLLFLNIYKYRISRFIQFISPIKKIQWHLREEPVFLLISIIELSHFNMWTVLCSVMRLSTSRSIWVFLRSFLPISIKFCPWKSTSYIDHCPLGMKQRKLLWKGLDLKGSLGRTYSFLFASFPKGSIGFVPLVATQKYHNHGTALIYRPPQLNKFGAINFNHDIITIISA